MIAKISCLCYYVRGFPLVLNPTEFSKKELLTWSSAQIAEKIYLILLLCVPLAVCLSQPLYLSQYLSRQLIYHLSSPTCLLCHLNQGICTHLNQRNTICLPSKPTMDSSKMSLLYTSRGLLSMSPSSLIRVPVVRVIPP